MNHRRRSPYIFALLLLGLSLGCASAEPEGSSSSNGSPNGADASTSTTSSDDTSEQDDTSSVSDTRAEENDTSSTPDAQDPSPDVPMPACSDDDDCNDDEHCAQGACAPGPCPTERINACGGCEPLRGVLGDRCGVCGTWACEGDTGQVVCTGDALNGCDTCATLEAEPGSPCDACGGVWQCSEDGLFVACSNDNTTITRNLCGQCQPISLDLGEPCPCGGTVVCNDARELAICDDGDNVAAGATVLPATDDDSNWREVTGSLNTALDEDWFTVQVEDRLFSNLEPEFQLIVPSGHDFDLCTYYVRTEGEPQEFRCDGDARIQGEEVIYREDGNRYQGCCLSLQNDATEGISLYWRTPPGEDDGGIAYMRVIYVDGAEDCAQYRLRYRF
ncbi:MAG: hypothetical protein AAFS10_10590 [Myxococcota bacterium]